MPAPTKESRVRVDPNARYLAIKNFLGEPGSPHFERNRDFPLPNGLEKFSLSHPRCLFPQDRARKGKLNLRYPREGFILRPATRPER